MKMKVINVEFEKKTTYRRSQGRLDGWRKRVRWKMGWVVVVCWGWEWDDAGGKKGRMNWIDLKKEMNWVKEELNLEMPDSIRHCLEFAGVRVWLNSWWWDKLDRTWNHGCRIMGSLFSEPIQFPCTWISPFFYYLGLYEWILAEPDRDQFDSIEWSTSSLF